ncbi:unnamed protein product [Adineta ricciae]|uniref:Uncharacterized protein n=1 Tax=Adineta ricciae TaxID=249248 RepID=A0A815T0H5_ADIRI|nr:unnamed protein product [Adineta ricciae]CAF1497901.1 unnamed protein product [Adineta ricciae]
MDTESDRREEQKTSLNTSVFAVDEHGICHFLQQATLSNSKEIVHKQNDATLSITSEELMQSLPSSNGFLSTQPFSIVTIEENQLSSLCLFNNNLPVSKPSPPLQMSGQIDAHYRNVVLLDKHSYDVHHTKLKKKRILRAILRRRSIFKKQLKKFLRNKKRKQRSHQSHRVSKKSIHEPVEENEFPQKQQITIHDLQPSPDLSKRKYIYRDITLTNTESNLMNWRIFQYTQQSSLVSTQNNRHLMDIIASPDIRVGLSKYHGNKHLHKQILVE